jgi:translation initiation factor 3 subunit H
MAELQAVQIEALVVMKILKHCSQAFPTIATGCIVGMDVGSTLQVTNCFPYPTIDTLLQPDGTGHNQDSSAAAANLAAAAPRARANMAYQNEMIKYLREVNVDANNVGWYTSASMGNFVTNNMIENQYFYQKEMNERTVALVHDTSRSSQGALSIRAFRLSPQFMAAYKENKFTTESLQKNGLRYQDILVELPITIHNSHLLTSLLHQLPSDPPSDDLDFPDNLASIFKDPKLSTKGPLYPNLDTLDLSIDPFLEKTCDLLLESIDTHHSELNNHQYYQRSLGREQAKIAAWQQKRKAENAARAASKQPLLPEDEWQRLFKLPMEPSRLEIMLNSRQIDQYARQVDGFAAAVSAKMFAVRSNLLPGEF